MEVISIFACYYNKKQTKVIEFLHQRFSTSSAEFVRLVAVVEHFGPIHCLVDLSVSFYHCFPGILYICSTVITYITQTTYTEVLYNIFTVRSNMEGCANLKIWPSPNSNRELSNLAPNVISTSKI